MATEKAHTTHQHNSPVGLTTCTYCAEDFQTANAEDSQRCWGKLCTFCHKGESHCGKCRKRKPSTQDPTPFSIIPALGTPGAPRPVRVRVEHEIQPIRDGAGLTSPGRFSSVHRQPPYFEQHIPTIDNILLRHGAPTKLKRAVEEPTKESPFEDKLIRQLQALLYTLADADESIEQNITVGHPLRLGLLQHLAKNTGDPDWRYPLQTRDGMPLGLEEPPSNVARSVAADGSEGKRTTATESD